MTSDLPTVRCLHAEARLAAPAPELRRARAQAARGDPEWRGRLEDYDRGDALIIALTAQALVDDPRAGPRRAAPCHYCHEAVWVSRTTTPRALVDRLGALARRDFRTVAASLRDRGVQLGPGEQQITVELVLDPAVTAALDSAAERT